jgi:hypothetical protein
MIMDYFSGLNFGISNHLPQCRAWIDREFPGAALNYAHAGRIRWAMNGDALQTLHAPVAWWTVPGVRYVYGNYEGESWDHYYVTFGGPRVRQMMCGGLLPGDAQEPHFRPIADAPRFRAVMEAVLSYVEGNAGSEAENNARGVHALEELLLQMGSSRRIGCRRARWQARCASGSSGFAPALACAGAWKPRRSEWRSRPCICAESSSR